MIRRPLHHHHNGRIPSHGRHGLPDERARQVADEERIRVPHRANVQHVDALAYRLSRQYAHAQSDDAAAVQSIPGKPGLPQ